MMAALIMQKTKARRIHKTQEQWTALQLELNKDPNFTVERVEKIAKKLKLAPKSVYKWVWDQTKGASAERRLADMLVLD